MEQNLPSWKEGHQGVRPVNEIYVVDDDQYTREILEDGLAAQGFPVKTFDDGDFVPTSDNKSNSNLCFPRCRYAAAFGAGDPTGTPRSALLDTSLSYVSPSRRTNSRRSDEKRRSRLHPEAA